MNDRGASETPVYLPLLQLQAHMVITTLAVLGDAKGIDDSLHIQGSYKEFRDMCDIES